MKRILSQDEMELALGEGVKRLRLQKNLDRQTLCDRAGISLNALRHLETGSGATIRTFVLVMRALEQTQWLDTIGPDVSVNPLHTVRGKPLRQRARRRHHGKTQDQ